MKYLIDTSDEFEKSLKEIAKNQRSIKKDIKKLGESLSDNSHQVIYHLNAPIASRRKNAIT